MYEQVSEPPGWFLLSWAWGKKGMETEVNFWFYPPSLPGGKLPESSARSWWSYWWSIIISFQLKDACSWGSDTGDSLMGVTGLLGGYWSLRLRGHTLSTQYSIHMSQGGQFCWAQGQALWGMVGCKKGHELSGSCLCRRGKYFSSILLSSSPESEKC